MNKELTIRTAAFALALGGVTTALETGFSQQGLDCSGPVTWRRDGLIPDYGRPLINFNVYYTEQKTRIKNGYSQTYNVNRRIGIPHRSYIERSVWDDKDVAICGLKNEKGDFTATIIQGRNGPPIILENVPPNQIFYFRDNQVLFYKYEDIYFREITYTKMDLNSGEIVSQETRNICQNSYGGCGEY